MSNRKKRLLTAVISSVVLLVAPGSASAYVYWSNSGGAPTIGRANTDGSSANQSFLSGLTGTPAFMDLQGDWVYWGTSGSAGPIGRAKVSGSSSTPSFMTFSSNARTGVEVTGTRIYWSDNTKKVLWADPSCPDPPATSTCKRANVATFSSGTAYPVDLAYSGGYAYWSQGSSIYRLAVSEATPVASLTATANPAAWKSSPGGTTSIQGIATDGTYIYYVDSTNAKIGRVTIADGTLDANFVTNLATGISSPATPTVFGLDVDSNYIYWTDTANDVIGRASVSGSAAPVGNFITGATDPYGVVVGGPFGTLSPSNQSFGSQPVAGGATTAETFTLSSSGASALSIDSAGITLTGADPSQFAISGGTCVAGSTSLASGQSCTVTVTFDPSSEGSKSASLSIATNDGTKVSTLSGSGTVPAGSFGPSTKDFGSRLPSAGPTAPETFVLSSTGSGNLSIDSGGITIGGADASEFLISGGSCAAGSTSMASGGSCTVTASFDPSAIGEKSATLQVATNDGLKTAALTGSGWDGRFLFWTSDDSGPGFSVGRSLTTGGEVNEAFAPGLVGEAGLMAGGENRIYWGTEREYASGSARIGRAAIDGSDTLPQWQLFGSSAQDRGAVTTYGRQLFWLTRYKAGSSEIGVAEAPDGGHSGQFITGDALGSNSRGIVADQSGIYWSRAGAIYRANLDGSGAALWKTTGATGIEGLAIDSSYVYYAARADGFIGRVAKSNQTDDPTFVTNLATGISGASTPQPHGVTVDASFVYWADRANGTIGRAPISGSNAPSGNFVAGLDQPTGVAIAYAAPEATVDPWGIPFGEQDVLAGSSASQTVTVTSSGLDSLVVGTPVLSGIDASDFALDSSGCAGVLLSAGSSCQMTISFDPSSVGSKVAAITVPSNSSLSPETVSLAGSGVDPGLPVARIDGRPKKAVTQTAATFRFSSGASGVTFECRLDGRPWAGCASPKIYRSIAFGQHVFKVRAVTALRTGVPVSYSWTIKRK